MEKEALTERIIGCCFAVHRELGPGFPERLYQRALQIALKRSGVGFESEKRIHVSFQGTRLGEFEMDLVVEGGVIVEVKAVLGVMPKVFEAQVISYLKAAQIPVGLLVNFGNRSCHIKRLVM